MFRITTNIIAARNLLYRRHPIEIQLAAIKNSSPKLKYKNPTERETCKIPPPPPPPPPRDDRLIYGALAILFATGCFTIYAKTQPEVRDWLSIHAPWFDDFIAVAYQENMTYMEIMQHYKEKLKHYMALKPRDHKPKQCSLDEPPLIGPKEAPCEGKEGTPSKKVTPPALTKGVCEIESCLRDLSETIINNYMTARDACAYYNKLVDETMNNFSMAGLRELNDAMNERIQLVNESVENVDKAIVDLDELSHYLECGVQAPKETLENSRMLLKENQDKIKTISMLYLWENDKSLAMDSQWQKVEEMVTKYTEANQTMFSGLNYESPKPTLKGDPDLLLYHTLRFMEKLKAELSEAVAGMSDRVNRAVEILPQGANERIARQYEITASFRKKKQEMDREYRKRADDQQAANAIRLRESLKKQLERSQETLTTRLAQKEKEAMKKLDKMVSEKVAFEKNLMAKQLYEMSMKLKLVEDKLNARLKAERETRRSQELWTAGASLLAATKKGDPYVNVDKELKAIEKASGDGDKLVLTVLKAIPESVRAQGLVPESVLREKYHTMEKTALKVALIEQDGAPLPIYFLSWLQSIFLFMKISGIPQDEIDKPPKEPSKQLDTFDLLQRARFWIERGNIANALRYVSSLEGASSGAAVAWRDAARSHLETRQAAEAVIAHAAALGLQYI